MSEIRERNGDMVTVDDLPEPVHHPRCNGRDGFTRPSDPLGRAAVPCVVCRPHLRVRSLEEIADRRPVLALR
jgi:hypothetical protein